MKTYNDVDIFDDDSIDNVTFEDHETITRIPSVGSVWIKHWLEANNIPFKRLRKQELGDRPNMTYFFEGHYYHCYFAFITKIKPEDLSKMALTLAYIDEYSKKYGTKPSSYDDDSFDERQMEDLFQD